MSKYKFYVGQFVKLRKSCSCGNCNYKKDKILQVVRVDSSSLVTTPGPLSSEVNGRYPTDYYEPVEGYLLNSVHRLLFIEYLEERLKVAKC